MRTPKILGTTALNLVARATWRLDTSGLLRLCLHSPGMARQKQGVPREAKVGQGVPGRLRPRMFLTFPRYKGGRSSAKRTGQPLSQDKSLVLTFRG